MIGAQARWDTRGRQAQKILWGIGRYLLILLFLAFFIFPIFWIVSTSLKVPSEYFNSPPTYLPRQPHLNHYIRGLTVVGGLKALRDSIIISGTATLLTVIIGATVAYSMARFRTGGARLSRWFLAQRMMPPVVMILPIFLLLRTVRLLDTHLGLILLYTVFNLSLCVWMLRSYFIDIPAEIEESALVDGASRVQVLRHITLPLVAGGLSATTVFVFIFAWTEFLFALVLTRNRVLTLPVLVSRFFGVETVEWGVASALAVIATVPAVILGLLVRRHFVRGITMGAVKD